MNFDAILFDLDGTLVNSLADLADSTNLVLAEAGYPTHPLPAYRFFVGNGVETLLRRALPAGEAEKLGEAFASLKERFRLGYDQRWHAKARPYDGMPDALAELNRRRIPLAVLTNKPQAWAAPFVRYFYPQITFVEIRGARPGVPLKPAPDAPLDMAARLGVAPARCLFVGDSNVDMRTAVNAGMFPLGVTWGFREPAELLEAGARRLIDRPAELPDFLDA